MARLRDRMNFENGALAAVRDAARDATGAYQDAARGLDTLKRACLDRIWDAQDGGSESSDWHMSSRNGRHRWRHSASAAYPADLPGDCGI